MLSGGIGGTRIRGAIAVFDVRAGLCTPSGLLQVYRDAVEGLGGFVPGAFVVDFRRPIVAFTERDMNALLPGLAQQFIVPAALVCSLGALPIFEAHGWAAAQVGVLRKAFTSAAEAERWCLLRLELARSGRTAP